MSVLTRLANSLLGPVGWDRTPAFGAGVAPVAAHSGRWGAYAAVRVLARALGLCLVAGVVTMAPAGVAQGSTREGNLQAALRIEPDQVELGEFSGLTASGLVLPQGEAEVAVLCEVPWELRMALLGPPRRDGDGIELPLERLRQILPVLPEELFALQPFEVASGDSAADWQPIEIDWGFASLLLQDYFEEEDPPGDYSLFLQCWLADREGNALTEPSTVLIRFGVEKWVELEMPDPDINIHVGEDIAANPPESQLVSLLVRSNSPWRMMIRVESELVDFQETVQVPLGSLQFRVETGQWEGWRPLFSDYVRVGLVGQEAVVGDGPAPFDVQEVEIPLRFLLTPEENLPAGVYSVRLFFEAAATEL